MNSFRNTNNGTVKHIIIINVICFVFFSLGIIPLLSKFEPILSLWYFDIKPRFEIWQLITHFFMHGSVMHILLNMYALYFLGTVLERVWGSKRFIFFYFSTGIGAAILYSLIMAGKFYISYGTIFPYSESYLQFGPKDYMLGASGAIYGLLAAFSTLFPNTELSLIFPPITLKAKTLVIGLIVYALVMGVINLQNDNVAHFAHITGALMGYLIVKYWQKNSNSFY